MKIRVEMEKLDYPKYFHVFLLVFFSCLFPSYVCKTNEYNLVFAMAEIPVFLFITYESNRILRQKKKLKDIFFLLLVAIYFLVFLYIDNASYQYYWPLIYKTCSFVLLWMLYQFDLRTPSVQKYLEWIENCIIVLFTFTVLGSLFGYIVGLDAIHLNLENISLRAQGVYTDNRLTWVFYHKSTYGLLINCVMCLVLKKADLPYRKVLIIIYVVALVAVNSFVSLVAAAIIIFVFFMRGRTNTVAFARKLIIVIFVALLVGGIGYFFLTMNRNISTMGSRIYIWGLAEELLVQYPYGMGETFGSISYYISEIGFSVNNLHNVFLNEMLHYSIFVGVLFTALLLYNPIRALVKSHHKVTVCIVEMGLFLPLLFDQALNDQVFPFYLLLSFLIVRDF